jgi:two-component system sensor histidine kinase RegB
VSPHSPATTGDSRPSPAPPPPPGAAAGAARLATTEPARIKLSWLLKLHWVAICGQTVMILAVHFWSGIRVPYLPLLGLVAVEVVETLALLAWSRRVSRVPEVVLAVAMLFDTVILTLLLGLSGGHFNPFSTLYLVNVVLASVLLPAPWSWAQLGASLVCFGSLFLLDFVEAPFGLELPDHAAIMSLHLQGMWVAFGIAAVLVVYLVERVTRSLAARERELARERGLAARKEKLASLATLAAGAAHELSTPLSTIAVVTRELERSLAGAPDPAAWAADLQLVRVQLQRCREILHQMGTHAGESVGEAFVSHPVARWLESALEGLDGARIALEVPAAVGERVVTGPSLTLARSLRGVVKNALEASAPDGRVRVVGTAEGAQVRLDVHDTGPGMPPEVLARAGEPFFTTKGPGAGMGLGLFLARAVAEQLGGALEIASAAGRGTRVSIHLPASAAGGAAAVEQVA